MTKVFDEISDLKGAIIEHLTVDDKQTVLYLNHHGIQVRATFKDAEPDCCEQRFMNTPDNLEDFVGTEFVSAELSNVIQTSVLGGGEVYESQFLRIFVVGGVLTIANYNIHNGCYSGFDITVTVD